MRITFVKNVFFVEGKIKSCIYDLNLGNLYHMGKEETNFIKSIVGENKETLKLSEQEKEIFDFLIEHKLLMWSSDFFCDGEVSNYITSDIDISFVWIEVTEKCNLRCIHCYEESSPQVKKRMELEDFKKVINELCKINVKKIQIIGGEPLILGDELKCMIDFAYGKFDLIEVFTNGTLMTEEWAKYFSEKGIKLALSVYSYESAEHDKVTGVSGSHTKTIKTLMLLDDYGVQYRTATVRMKEVNIGKQKESTYNLERRDIIRLTGRAKMQLLSKELLKEKLITYENFSNQLNIKLVKRMLKGHNCFARRLYISTDLTVYPCVMERKIIHGSMKDNGLLECTKMDIMTLGKNVINGCKDCEFRYCCHDCRPDRICNEEYEKPWKCTYNPLKAEWRNIEEYCDELMKSSQSK